MSDQKYLSIIYTGRNDDYARGFLNRFQISLSCLSYLSKKTGIDKDIEIIIAEWNPIPGKKKLKDVLSLPKNIDTRIIEISNDIHKRIPATPYDADNARSIPFYEFIGKNVAVRRANSPFVLCTNPDIIFNEHLVRYLSKKDLSSKHFYRIDKDNLLHDVNIDKGRAKLLRRCEADLDPRMQAKNAICRKRYVHTKASGDFLLIPTEIFKKMNGYLEIRTGGGALDRFGLYCARIFAGQIILDLPMRIFHQPHTRRSELYEKKISAGSMNTDYSTEHSTFHNKNVKVWFNNCLKEMQKNKKNMNVNKSNWGLVDYKLPEEFIERAE